MRTTTVDGFYIEDVEIVQWEGIGQEPATSTVGNARIYFNPITGKLRVSEDGGEWADLLSTLSGDARYLKLDQTTPQTVTGQPRFVTSGTITRTGGVVSAITIGGRTKTYSRNASGFVTSMYDGQNVWTYVRDVNNNLLSWSVA